MDDATDVELNAARFQALGDPTRRRVIEVCTAGTRCACEMRDRLDVPGPLLSHHLRVVRDAGIVAATRVRASEVVADTRVRASEVVADTRVRASDVVTDDEREARGPHTGCIAGARPRSTYLAGLHDPGFAGVDISITNTVADGVHRAAVRATKPATTETERCS